MYMYIYINCQHTIKALYQMHTHVCYILYFIEVIIQQLSEDIEVLKKELYKYQHSSGK